MLVPGESGEFICTETGEVFGSRPGDNSESEADGRPILVKNGLKDAKESTSPLEITKCSCGGAWCLVCWPRRGLKEAWKYLQTFDFKRTRTIMLSCDPSLFDGPEQSYIQMKEKKAISRYIRDLERHVLKEKISKWIWFREWHKNGFQHFHLIVEVEKSGKDGMIGIDLLRKYWKYGWYIHEDWFRNREHWDRVIGYFGKNGYFKKETKDKTHQVTLPEWALDLNIIIRRYDRKREVSESCSDKKPSVLGSTIENASNEGVAEKEKKPRNIRESYRVRLSKCGAHAIVDVRLKNGYQLKFKTEEPYKEILKLGDFKYKQDVGMVGELPFFILDKLVKTAIQIYVFQKRFAFPSVYSNDKGGWKYENKVKW